MLSPDARYDHDRKSALHTCPNKTFNYRRQNVLGPFLPSFTYINCIVYIANIVFIDYHFFSMLLVRYAYNINFFPKILISDH